jgi:predicted amidohydrolase
MVHENNFLKVAAYQGQPIEGNPDKALNKMFEVTQKAHADRVDALCFPETFLHGYFQNEEEAREYSCDLQSEEFREICRSFKAYSPKVIFGLNERKGNSLYNTAVAIDKGELKGAYRKHHTYPPYDYYALGEDTPLIEIKGVKIGIIICYDSTFLDPARSLAQKGARILFMPSFNRVFNDSPMPRYLDQRNHLVARSGENDCWLVVSDITCKETESHCPGYSCIYSSDGDRIVQSLPYQEMMISYDIPLQSLNNVRSKRLAD